MAQQWGQPGFQYSMQTGFPGAQPQQQFQTSQPLNPASQFQSPQGGFGGQPAPSGLGAGFGGLTTQPTGFPGVRPQGFAQPQQSGFPGASGVGTGFLQMQPTGFPGAQTGFQQRPPPPPIPPLPSSYQQSAPPPPPPAPQQQPSFLNANQNRLGAPSLLPQPTGIGFMPQPTGFAGRAPGPLVPQVTGFVDPRLQMMFTSFMPANVSAPYTSGGAPQLAPPPQQQLGGLSLQQSFQQHNQAHGRGVTPKIPWGLSKAEKKQYDQMFRAWDAQGTGFIDGPIALEVFGQSGLDRNDLARIWTLADADNRGKLNLAEFHVAMGLIYRRLNGSDIPDELPAELVPPSSRDLDTSVNFLKDILKNDTRSRSPAGLDTPVSRLKERSFTSSSSFTQQGGRQDATVYKHEDVEPPGGFYQPPNRHVDRSTVRSRADGANPAATDLSSIKMQLLNTQKMLDNTLANERSSDALDRELEDLRHRITRLQDDLEYVSKGPRSIAKDEDRRRLERELVRLMHEEVPELEKKVEEREARKEREKREWARDRDRRNERFGRFGDGDSERYSPASRNREEEERPYSRNASRYDRGDRDADRDRSYKDEERDQDRNSAERGRGSSSTAARSPPPAPPPAPVKNTNPSAPPPPARSPAPALKNMTSEERQAYIRAEAQRRLEARKQALGVVAPSSISTSPILDTTIEDRLAKEKKEAEEKAREAERQAEEREKQRREKLEAEKALKDGKTPPPMLTPTQTAASPAPTSVPVPPPVGKTGPHKRPPVPPPPRKVPKPTGIIQVSTPTSHRPPPQSTPVIRTPIPPAPVVAPAPPPPAVIVPEEDPEDVALKAREEALRKKREERAALLRKLEQEEEEARKAEEAYTERRNQFLAKASLVANASSTTTSSPVPTSPPPPTVPAPSLVPEELTEPETSPPPPPPPPAPPVPVAPTSTLASDKPSNNPFRLMTEGGGVTPPVPPAAAANGRSNPFFRTQTAPPAPLAPPESPSIPPPVKTTYHPPNDSDDDWDDVVENGGDDSSDEEFVTRDTRRNLAQELFGGLLPSRPQSAGPVPSATSPTSPAAPAPPPPPPSAPPAPVAASVPIATPAPTGDRGALLSAIQGGARLRKTVTNDRSGAAASGKVIGDTAPPTHINAVASPLLPPAVPALPPASSAASLPPSQLPLAPSMEENPSSGHGKRESVDWYNGLAADTNKREIVHLPATVEEAEEEADAGMVPAIHVSEHAHARDEGSELMADVDLSTTFRVRSLYPYAGQRAEDLDFDSNNIIVAHPSKSGGDWWYGFMVKDGKAGFFPQTYVQKVEQVRATALYPYEDTSADELSFNEGDALTVVDRSETDWWKVERDGLVFVAPAAYLEVIEGPLGFQSPSVPKVSEADADGRGVGREGTDDVRQGVPDRGERETTDVYSTPNSSPQDSRRSYLVQANGPHKNRPPISMNVDEDEDEGAYYSVESGEGDDGDSDDGDDMDDAAAAAEARENERRRVLEAAGLVVSSVSLPARATDIGGNDNSNNNGTDTGTVLRSPRPARLFVPPIDVDDRSHTDGIHGDGARRPSAPPVLSISSSAGSELPNISLCELEFSPGGRKRLLLRPRPPPPPAPLGPRRPPLHPSAKDLPPVPTLDTRAERAPDTLFASFGGTADDAATTATDDGFKDFEKETGCGGGGGAEGREGEEGALVEGEHLATNRHFKMRSDGSIVHPDDAFERYETFKKKQASHHGGLASPLFSHGSALASASTSRMSMSSLESGSLAVPSPPKSPAASLASSLRERMEGESRASQFLSFLGRHARAGTPEQHHERDRKLVISGPIPIAPSPLPISTPLTAGGEDDRAFGSSWASLVDRSALEGIPKQERKRQEAIFELISTEADYVRDVQLVVELFYSRLMAVMDEKATAMIFSNIEDILLTNTTFLSTLEERQRDCRLYIDHIGDLLEKHMPNMSVYLNYCVNQANGGKALQQMREYNQALATQLQNLREDPSARNLDLSSYLLAPMQRLTRYPLLIRQILQYTDPGSLPPENGDPSTHDHAERQSISRALQIAEKTLEEVNETIREREGRERLGEISRTLWIGHGRLDLTAPTRYLGVRKLVKEGVLSKAKSGRKLRVVLCNDILVLVNEADKGLYHVPIPVHEIEIKASRRSGRDDPFLRLHVVYPRGGDTIVLRAANTREAKAWEDVIVDVRSKARESMHKRDSAPPIKDS